MKIIAVMFAFAALATVVSQAPAASNEAVSWCYPCPLKAGK